LEKWLNEVLCLSEREGWGIDIQNELTEFLEPDTLSESTLNIHEIHSSEVDVRQSRAGSLYENEVTPYLDPASSHNNSDDGYQYQSNHQRSSNYNLLNETWPPLIKRPSLTPTIPPRDKADHHHHHHETASRAGSIASRRLSSIFTGIGCQYGYWEGYDDESDFVVIFEGSIKDVKLGALAITNKWRSGYWKLVWSDVSKSEAALLRYREKDLPPCSECPITSPNSNSEVVVVSSSPDNLDGSGGGGGGGVSRSSNYHNGSHSASKARDVLPLRIVRAVDKLSDDRLKKVISKNAEFGFSFILSLVDGNEVILATETEQDREEWMGILYSTLVSHTSFLFLFFSYFQNLRVCTIHLYGSPIFVIMNRCTFSFFFFLVVFVNQGLPFLFHLFPNFLKHNTNM
jgi:hypothetical protein